MDKIIINSDRAPEPVGAYPHARRVGNLLFLSGVGPRERGTRVIPGVTLNDDGTVREYDIEAQTLSVFRNIRYIIEDDEGLPGVQSSLRRALRRRACMSHND